MSAHPCALGVLEDACSILTPWYGVEFSKRKIYIYSVLLEESKLVRTPVVYREAQGLEIREKN